MSTLMAFAVAAFVTAQATSPAATPAPETVPVATNTPAAETGPAPSGTAASTTLSDRTDVSITAYNNGMALVRDARRVKLPTGEVQLQFQDVSELIRPETVSLRSLTEAGSVTILEQNYEYDLISPQKLMEKYIGKQVKLLNFSQDVEYPTQQRTQEATLLSTNEGAVYQVGNDIYLGYPGTVVLPEIPENLIARPSLIWGLQNAVAEQELEATYLTNGLSWVADYVVTIPRDESSLDIGGWVTLTNQSGATYTNARLKLVAGDVNIAPPPQQNFMKMARAEMAMDAGAAPMPQQEAFGEYHLYTMPRRSTLKQNQSKQLALLDVAGVKYTKIYEYTAEPHWIFQIMPPMKDQKVAVSLKFQNEEANAMGMPLPGGVMRVYQEDSEETLQFVGEDRIGHTPKDEEVSIKIGNAFDVVVERTQKDFSQISSNVWEAEWEVLVRNHKAVDVVVDIVEPMSGDWEILEKSMDFEKRDAYTAVFHLPVPKDGEAKVTYRVRVRQG